MSDARVALRSILLTIPRVTRDQWNRTGVVVRWLIVSRAAVLVLTVTSCLVGGLLALLDSGQISVALWCWCCFGLIAAHATNNQLNDLVDHARGVDAGNYFRNRYGTHALNEALLSSAGLRRYIVLTGAAAGATGVYLIWSVGPQVLPPFLVGALLVVFYTHPLKGWGLGEAAVWLAWGPLMVAGTHMVVLQGHWDWPTAAIGLVYGVGPTLVILGKHVDKLELDTAKGIGTLPVRLGARRSRGIMQALVAFEYVATGALVVAGWLPMPVLLVALAVPGAVRLVRQCGQSAPERCPDGYSESVWPLWFAASAFAHARAQGGLFVAGLLIAVALDAAT